MPIATFCGNALTTIFSISGSFETSFKCQFIILLPATPSVKNISSTVCAKQKAPNHRMHVTALLYKGMMSTPPFQTPAVSVYLLDHPHVSLRQNSFYKKSRRGFCHECHKQRSCKNCLASNEIVKNLRKQLPFLCN